LKAANALLDAKIRTVRDLTTQKLNDPVSIQNVTYQKISNTSYAVIFTWNISNIRMSKNPNLRNDTYNQVQSIINNALNTLLNEPGAEKFEPQSPSFM
ncbi:hypothetical protein PDJAM_G00180690, partial [Pangasius djambal]|nr:hypothetical protein [Pangasius djambal]